MFGLLKNSLSAVNANMSQLQSSLSAKDKDTHSAQK
jgi:hypothetical protein